VVHLILTNSTRADFLHLSQFYNISGKDANVSSSKQVLEKGHAYFFYRPKIDVGDKVEGANDVQRFHMVLLPEGATHSTHNKRKAGSPPQSADPKSPKRSKTENNSKDKENTKSPQATSPLGKSSQKVKDEPKSPKQVKEEPKSAKQKAKDEPISPQKRNEVKSPKQNADNDPKSPIQAGNIGATSALSRLIVIGAKRLPAKSSRARVSRRASRVFLIF